MMNAADETIFPVVETFSSIQGESTHAGRQCFFIRFAVCNLRCSYCDTAYAWEASAATLRSIAELLAAVRESGLPLVELTGGEPLLQPGLPELARALLEDGREVLLETNGSLPLDMVPPDVRKIVDVKLPSSGMSEYNNSANYPLLGPGDELKFVTGGRSDFEWALAWIDRHRLAERGVPLIFSPVFGAIDPAELAQWLIDSRRPELRMQIQMHKVLWHPDRRGV
ncbi:7-carboxy-7-deazaguanine synthase [bioreactor metagenome]|uniref:7-carboxy-7-deazaguanine synthase n=1 Tax=bioreactor metagenome TaxID=1076179 RepID=A0A645C6Y5_9ZZZZ